MQIQYQISLCWDWCVKVKLNYTRSDHANGGYYEEIWSTAEIDLTHTPTVTNFPNDSKVNRYKEKSIRLEC